jgi:hypothetical protein
MTPCPCTCPPASQCRRCGQNILDGRLTAYVVTQDDLEGDRLDLCRDCAGLFTAWFLRRPTANPPLRGRVRSGGQPLVPGGVAGGFSAPTV